MRARIILLILVGMKPLEERYLKRRRPVEVQFQAQRGAVSLADVQRALGWRASRVKQLVVRSSTDAASDEISLTVESFGAKDIDEMLAQLSRLAPVADIRIAQP